MDAKSNNFSIRTHGFNLGLQFYQINLFNKLKSIKRLQKIHWQHYLVKGQSQGPKEKTTLALCRFPLHIYHFLVYHCLLLS